MDKLKICTLVLILITSTFSISAQNNLNFGFSAGIDLVKVHSPKLNNTETQYGYASRVSYNLNAYINYPINDKWSISAEPGYMRKGTALKIKDQSSTFMIDANSPLIQHHIQLPILVNYSFVKNLILNLGPEISYIFDPTHLSSVPLPAPNFELSGLIGLTHKINESFGVSLRYNHGISAINSIAHISANSNYDGTLNEYNQYLQLMVRYTI